ncbi:hypothetical protein [Salinicoccus carnicancri]|uniref:hypothetical protein n=1 Tax=Salinicoccus carnicancri TaxID=558170 RepID=UPI0002FC64FA|nr:hypothetical protein [Salinicoccus carnicancri]
MHQHIQHGPRSPHFFWFSVFGVGAIEAEKTFGGFGDLATEEIMFEMFNNMPMGLIISIIASAFPFSIILIFVMIATYKDISDEQKALNLLIEPDYEGTRYEKMMKEYEEEREREGNRKNN